MKDPLCLVLGTFYDQRGNCSEPLDHKNALLRSLLKPYKEFTYVYRTAGEEIIHPLNAVSRGEDKKKLADEIRRKISQSYIEADIPIRWFFFRLELEKKASQDVISKSICIRIGSGLDMNEDDVEATLMYYHDLTIYLYFPKVLSNVVFLNPQPLLNKLSKLISISFVDNINCLEDQGISISPEAHKELKEKGIFSKKLLTECKYFLQLFSEFSPDDFLKLMEHLLILSPLPDLQKYFLPCVLETANDNELESLKSDSTDPLILTWNQKPLPQGVFSALVVNLLSRKRSPTFNLSRSKKPYRNAILLSCRTSLWGAVLLVDGIERLEIFCKDNCHRIYQVIKKGIKIVIEKFHYSESFKVPEE